MIRSLRIRLMLGAAALAVLFMLALLPALQRAFGIALENTIEQRLAADVATLVSAARRDFSPSFSVPVERGALLELLGNLLENAYRLCLGRVRVGARLGPGYSELWVEDDGPGVPAEQRARIIRRGERADTQHPGQGIGLAVALDIIESYDGELSLDDSELGGACFRIRFATV
uniref:histidine kinase n=1 Tax=Pseudomonas aeruginosa TaxID=287 RepID=G9JLA2_PSEAI|nr:PhoQ [Pseudomonas aeruginosa]